MKLFKYLRDAVKYIAAVGPVTLDILGIKNKTTVAKVVEGVKKIDPLMPDC